MPGRIHILSTFILILAGLPVAVAEDAGEPSPDQCEFEQPSILGHYFPVFMEDPEAAGWDLPLVDFITDREGKPIDAALIGDPVPPKAKEAIEFAAGVFRFSPAVACGQRTEGFARIALRGYCFVEADSIDGLSSPPIPRFVFPESYFALLRLNASVATEDNGPLTFILSVTEEGEIEEFEGTCEWTKHLSKKFMPMVFEGYRFIPAKVGEEAVPAEVVMRLDMSRHSINRELLEYVSFESKQTPLPKRPKGIEYRETKVFEVGLVFSPEGLMEEIWPLDLLETEEMASLLNAFRNWYLPAEDDSLGSRSIHLKLAFSKDSDRALLLEKTEDYRLLQLPVPVKQSPPRYPAKARRAALQGATEVTFVVGKDGSVLHAEASASSHPTFVDAALKAVRKWKFQPGKVNGKPANMRCHIVIPFKFRS